MGDLLYVAYIHGGTILLSSLKRVICCEPHCYKVYYKDGEPVGAILHRAYDDKYTNVVAMHVTNTFTIDMWRDIRKKIKSGTPTIINIVDNKDTLTRLASLYAGIRVGSNFIFNKDNT